jgi:hypothetical protein
LSKDEQDVQPDKHFKHYEFIKKYPDMQEVHVASAEQI